MDVAYKIVSHSDFKDTEDEVNALLKEHWELLGDLKVISGTPTTYAQAMVQREYYGGSDYNLSVQIDDLDDIKYALKDIAEAIETAATALGYAAAGLSDKPSESTQPQATFPTTRHSANKPHSAKKASRKKR
jgi:hypothetical protein